MLLSVVMAAAAATAAPDQLPQWLNLLQGPILGGFIVAILTQVLKAIPGIPVTKGPRVAAAAAILSVIAGAISAYASGDLSGFDVNSAWTILVSSIVTFMSATGAHEAKTHTDALLQTRGEVPPAPSTPSVPDSL